MWFTNEFLLYSVKLAYDTINNKHFCITKIMLYRK